MSKFVKVKTELRDLGLVKRALDDLKIQYGENQRYAHVWSGFSGTLPLVVKHGHFAFGLRPTEDGVFEVVGDDMQMSRVRPLLNQVQQRYAYHKIIAETEKAGFALVEETVGRDDVIRLTMRRWN